MGIERRPLEQECDSLLPLSLIALKAVISKLSLNRLPSQTSNLNDDVIPVLSHQELDPLFRRKVNPKKEHELRVFAPLIHSMAEMTSTSAVFDFGSGIGHLCRRLSFIHGLHSFGLETQEVLTVKAKEMDELFVKKMKSRSPSSHILPVHSVHNISEETLQSHTQDSLFKNQEHHGVGLVGLHACGDLSSRIIRLYKASSSSKFLCLATCCYMKGNLNLMSSDFSHRSLSYEARELGCHALETYIKKLKSDDYESLLRVHCYRALLERILIRKGSQYKHISLKSVPQTHRLSFEEYALAATANLKELNISATEMKEAEMDLEKEWWKECVFWKEIFSQDDFWGIAMPSFLKLRFKSSSKQQYNVLSKSVYVLTVELLDNSVLECTLSSESTGRDCMNNVCQRLGLLQSELMGLRYVSKRKSYPKIRWVDLDRLLKKQLDKYAQERPSAFIPRSHVLRERRLSSRGPRRLRCNYEQAIVLASYSLQAEFGDHELEKTHSRFEDKMDVLTDAIITQHASLRGIAQQLAEVYYVVGAQQLDGYGQECFLAKDNVGNEVLIGASLTGIVIRKGNGVSPSFFKWNDITNLVNHKRYFGIEFQNCEYPLQFIFEEAESAKYVWKMCVMQHSFYKQHSSAPRSSAVKANKLSSMNNLNEISYNNVSSYNAALTAARSVNDLVDSSNLHRNPMDLSQTAPNYRPVPDYETAVKNKLYLAKNGNLNNNNSTSTNNNNVGQSSGYPIYNNQEFSGGHHPHGNLTNNTSINSNSSVKTHQPQYFIQQYPFDDRAQLPPLQNGGNPASSGAPPQYFMQQYSSTPELSVNNHHPPPLPPLASQNNPSQPQQLPPDPSVQEQIVAELQRLNIYKPPPPYPYTSVSSNTRMSSNSTPDLASGLMYQESGFVGGSSPDLVSRRNLGLVYGNSSNNNIINSYPYDNNRRQSFSGRSNLMKEEPIYQNQQQIRALVSDKEPIYQNLISFEKKEESVESNQDQDLTTGSSSHPEEEIHIDNTVNSGHQGIGGLTNSREDISNSIIHHAQILLPLMIQISTVIRTIIPTSLKLSEGGKSGTERSPGNRSRPSMLAAFSGLTRSRPDLLSNSVCEEIVPPLRISSPSKMGKEEIGPYLEGKLVDGEVLREFEMIPRKRESASSFFAATLPENILRNRFEHVLPYDDNRVNRIESTLQLRFNIRLIVMLTDTRSCVQYWPTKKGSLLELKDFRILKKSSSDSKSYVTSSLEVLHVPSGLKRNLWHSQYTDWSERGVPNDPMRYVAFLEELEALRSHTIKDFSTKNSPILVHCSAGVGRTGVTILCDILLYCVDRNIHVDIPKILSHLRQQRMLMKSRLI
ncbi:PTPN14_21 [Lepeophtheirus salmonis]|uniref:protein-tyrosine-phosphatase n=1 Tax=Lepeophtheirus salmonis TaxID=72036 RepID=A0A7R8CGK3_LEPSM|nr:PTPN14_21 [Lepeophtheirus salmonis]CAF2810743.1 PTPN14_21 [Lepeophtheirus salmonis]